MCAGCKNGHEESGETIVAGDKVIEVAKEDFPELMTWSDAFKACKELGSGWRLPNNEELSECALQLHLNELGSFKNDSIGYWSCSRDELGFPLYFRYDSLKSESHPLYFLKEITLHVRAVRTLP
jgi:hypothetical protein